jgi:uncharacterized protein YbaR (Trm112 family)
MEANNIDNLKEKTDSQIKLASKTEFPEIKKEIHKYKRKKLILDYATRGLDICGVCKQKYNLGDRIPRILVHCGHTFCTSCLIKFHHIDHIRCPYCKKLINNIDSPSKIESLPLNLNIFGELVKTDPVVMMLIDPDNPTSLTSLCSKHPEKQKHFYCSFHETNFCRDCIKVFHKQNECCVVDLYDIDKLYQLNEQNIKKNNLIIKCRKKVSNGRMRKEEFFISNY